MIEIRQLNAAEVRRSLPALARVLADCVNGGASVNFLLPFTQEDAERYFASLMDDVEAGKRIVFSAFREAELVGTVQLVTAVPPNQPHRAEVAKLLVLSDAREAGVATLLMQRLEATARELRKLLLVLDTVTGGAAERLYLRLGWTKAGVIPNYALFPDGSWCDTSVFWKHLD